MVAAEAGFAGGGLGEGCATEFGGEEEECVFEHAALFEIFDECGDGLVDHFCFA